MAKKLPHIQFYPGDWMKDPNLRRCTPAEKGVWIDMLCLMYECDERGVFATGGRPWSLDEIACAVGGDTRLIASHIEALIEKGVAKRRADGAVYSRRLVRDEEIRTKRAESGSKGGSKTQANHQANFKQKTDIDNDTDNESSSPDSSVSNKRQLSKHCTPSQAEALYALYPRHVGKREAIPAIQRAVERIATDKGHPGRGDPLTWLQRRVGQYAASPRGQPPTAGDTEFRPHPATWFNQGRYDDDDNEWQQPNGTSRPTGSNPTRQGRDDWRERKQSREHPHDEAPPASL